VKSDDFEIVRFQDFPEDYLPIELFQRLKPLEKHVGIGGLYTVFYNFVKVHKTGG